MPGLILRHSWCDAECCTHILHLGRASPIWKATPKT